MGLFCAALAIYDESPKLSEEVIKLTFANIQKGLSQCYSKNGMYIEGYGYWSGTTFFQSLFINALYTSFGEDFGMVQKYSGYAKNAEFALNMNSGANYIFNFFDSEQRYNSRQSLLFWFVKLNGDYSILYPQRYDYKKNVKASTPQELFPLIWCSDLDFGKIEKPKNFIWKDCDSENPIFIARSGWECDDLFFGVKGGSASLSHAHMDASSFVFDGFGERWAFDLGGQNYNSLEKLNMKIWSFLQNSDRWKVFLLNNFSHNVIVVNDMLFDVNANIRFKETFNGEHKKGVKMDTTKLYFGSLKKSEREIFISENKKLVIIDSIENGDRKSKVSWRMVCSDNIEIVDVKTVKIKSPNRKTAIVKLDTNSNFTVKILPAQGENSWDAKVNGKCIISFEGTLSENEKSDLKVEIIPIKN